MEMNLSFLSWPMLLPAWMLVVARAAGLVLAAPLFSSVMMPGFFRVALVLSLSAMVFPVVLPTLDPALTVAAAVSGLVGELLLGTALGLAASVVLLATQIAGHFVAQQAGLAIGSLINPTLDVETTPLQEVWSYAAWGAFLLAGGATGVVEGMLDSFRVVPPLALFDAAPADGHALTAFAAGSMRSAFSLTTRLAAPALVALALSSLVMGFLVKTMPQFNVLTIGFGVKVVLGIFIVALTVARSGPAMTADMHDALRDFATLVRDLAGAGRAR